MQTARELYLPAPGSPHWLPGGEPPGGLLYLAWGRRYYGRHPIPLRLHHGWTCIVVTSGNPVFLVADRRHRTAKGSVIVAGPDVPYGWQDRRTAASSHLAWIWSQPLPMRDRIAPRTCWLRMAESSLLSELEDLHVRTRREIQRPDDFSPEALAAIKALLGATLSRCGLASRASGTGDQQRLWLAEQWMQRHLDIRAPAAALADYLGLSAMGLHRLFRQSTGLSPGRAFLEIKMRAAEAMLSRGKSSVKEVALGLGYRHPGDFTRAFAKFHGHSPATARSAVISQKRSV